MKVGFAEVAITIVNTEPYNNRNGNFEFCILGFF